MDPHFVTQERRVRLEDGREGTEHRAPIDALWSITLDDGEVLYFSEVNPPGTNGRPNYDYI